MFVCTVVLVLYLWLLLNLNMNEIVAKHMVLLQFIIVYDCSPNVHIIPMWLRPKNDKISLYRVLAIKSMKRQMKSDEKFILFIFLHGFCK